MVRRPVCEQNESAESTQSNTVRRSERERATTSRAGGTRLPAVLHALSSRHSLVQNALTSLVCRLTRRDAAVVWELVVLRL
jgi:hypothetical protein